MPQIHSLPMETGSDLLRCLGNLSQHVYTCMCAAAVPCHASSPMYRGVFRCELWLSGWGTITAPRPPPAATGVQDPGLVPGPYWIWAGQDWLGGWTGGCSGLGWLVLLCQAESGAWRGRHHPLQTPHSNVVPPACRAGWTPGCGPSSWQRVC